MELHQVRHSSILELLSEVPSVRVTQLAQQLGVSEMTIRRDLKMLEEQGELRRVHGGAIRIDRAPQMPEVQRAGQAQAGKKVIARLAADLIDPGMSVFLGGGSTMRCFAETLPRDRQAMYFTNSIKIAETVQQGSGLDVHVIGGILRGNAGTLIGPETIEALESRYFDLALISVSALKLAHGFLDPTEWHAWLSTTLRKRSAKIAVLIDQSKFDTPSDFRAFSFADVDFVVSDAAPNAAFRAAIEENGGIILCPEDAA